MKDALRDGLSTIAEFVPKLVLFLVILIVGMIVVTGIANTIYIWLRARSERWLK